MNLAILGAGMIVHDFLTVAGDVPQLELSAIFGTENDLEKMNHLKQQYGIQTVYTELGACLADPSVDTVYVALPNHLHYSFAKEAILAGKHVICEKPFSRISRIGCCPQGAFDRSHHKSVLSQLSRNKSAA